MFGHLRRLATTGAAYTASSVVSRVIAVFLLPIYTAYLTPADYGAAEVMLAAVIAASIIVRFGLIEALLRFYYQAGEQPRAVVATAFWGLLAGATVVGLALLPFAEDLARVLLKTNEADAASAELLASQGADLARLAILGLWILTMWEFVLTMLRLEERAKAYFVLTVANVLVTIPVTVYLVVVADLGAEAILIGNFVTTLPFIAIRVWAERHRLNLLPDLALLRRMLRFGLPTMPAEVTLYALNFVDRIIIIRLLGLTAAGIYALAIKFSNAMQVLSRGFQLAFPPLAYAIEDDDEARSTYALIVTWFAAFLALAVAGLWLLAPWIVRLLSESPSFYPAADVVGPLALAGALYAMYITLVVVLGRTGRTEFNLPATAAAATANIGLNLLLIPIWGLIGAAVALIISYVIVLILMYFFTQRLFSVPWDWRRLALVVVTTGAVIAIGENLTPEDGLAGFLLRAALIAALPFVLHISGFLSDEERSRISAARRSPLGRAKPDSRDHPADSSASRPGSAPSPPDDHGAGPAEP